MIPGTAEANSYIDIIEKYLESYAYRDILLNPPAPLEYQAVDFNPPDSSRLSCSMTAVIIQLRKRLDLILDVEGRGDLSVRGGMERDRESQLWMKYGERLNKMELNLRRRKTRGDREENSSSNTSLRMVM